MRQELIKLRGKRKRIDVASALDITPQMLGAIERGKRNPSRTLTKKMADYYKVTTDEIIFFIDKGNETCPKEI